MTHYDWVIAAITVGSLTGAILAGAYAIEQRSQRQAQQRRAEEAEMWLMPADEEVVALRQRLAAQQRRNRSLQQMYAALLVSAADTCLWRLDDDGYYATQCGQAYTAFDEGLSENHYRYCPWCGRAIVEAHDAEEQSEDE